MPKKIKTYQITFINNNKEDETEFCAYTSQEAKNLFREFCITDLKLKDTLPILTINQVFNQEDEELYKENYVH